MNLHYECSACHRPIGWIEGMFKCPHRGNQAAHCIPDQPVRRKAPPLPIHLRPVDLSERAKKKEIVTKPELSWELGGV